MARYDMVVEKLLEKMFEFSGKPKTYAEIENLSKTDSNWFSNHTMTDKQQKAWEKWGIAFIAKQLKIPKREAAKEMAYVNLQWGLRIED